MNLILVLFKLYHINRIKKKYDNNFFIPFYIHYFELLKLFYLKVKYCLKKLGNFFFIRKTLNFLRFCHLFFLILNDLILKYCVI